MDLKINIPSISTREAAVLPYHSKLEKNYTVMSRYGDPIQLCRTIGEGKNKKLLLPRHCCPIGEDLREEGTKIQTTSTFIPRDKEQERLVAESYKYLSNDMSHIMQAVTGKGKTIMATQLIHLIGRKALVIVHKEDLKIQWIQAFKKILNLKPHEIGIIQGDTCDVVGKKVCIAMVQSAAKLDRYPRSVWNTFGFMIVDETHIVAADTFSNVCWTVPAKLRLGVSATPERKDGKDIVLYAHIGPILVKSDSFNLVPRVLILKTNYQVPLVKRKIDGQYKMVPLPHSPGKISNVIKDMAKNRNRNLLITNFVQSSYRNGRSVVVLSEHLAHLETLMEYCIMYKVPQKDMGYYVGGKARKKEREESKTKPVIFATYAMMSTGTDIPWLDTLVFATPRSDVRQSVGRILREYEDKKEPVVLDIADPCSSIITGYFNKRVEWYQEIGAEVVKV